MIFEQCPCYLEKIPRRETFHTLFAQGKVKRKAGGMNPHPRRCVSSYRAMIGLASWRRAIVNASLVVRGHFAAKIGLEGRNDTRKCSCRQTVTDPETTVTFSSFRCGTRAGMAPMLWVWKLEVVHWQIR